MVPFPMTLKKSNSFLVVHWTYRRLTLKSYKNLLGSSPDRYARGSANRLNAVIASTTQLGSPRNHPRVTLQGAATC